MVTEEKKLSDYVKNIFTKKFDPTDAEVKSFVWAVNRILSMEKDLLEHIAYLSRFMFTLEARYYKLLMRTIPQSFPPRNKYIKADRLADSELLSRYCQYFKLSKKETQEYLKILAKKYTQDEIHSFIGIEYIKQSEAV